MNSKERGALAVLEHSGAHAEGANRTAKPYIRAEHDEKERPDARAHLLAEQGVAPLPGAGTVALSESAGVANDLDAPAPGGTLAPARDGWNVGRATEPRLVRCRERGGLEATSTGKTEAPPTPDEAPADDAMLRRLDATRAAALRWLDRDTR